LKCACRSGKRFSHTATQLGGTGKTYSTNELSPDEPDGNISQIKKTRKDFKTAKRVYSQNRDALPAQCVNGCCYGKQPRKNEHKGDYIKLCGQRFWEFISGDPELYIKIIEPLGHKAKERNEEFMARYEVVLDEFTALFRQHFCDASNVILWDKLTEASSKAP
jgi:hypothetical protein